MDARLNIYENKVSVKFLKYITAAAKVFSSLPTTTLELVSLRISQINGCAFCVDMHTKEALHEGETPLRLNLVAVWREANVFTEAERAALALAEQGTRIGDAAEGVTDAVWENAAKHYDEDELAALVSLISFMNTVNRMNVITQQAGGDYELGWVQNFG
ncbi:carboxymuconolactone decarboxylase family protein [Streptomyces cavernicola]|uniref:Carboxymuconolactone decarboxylase family protein n=1 Tax=Streptomyces cavernicola TaxID=3043613 RepID=A0ABT6SML1_9ACTN|nr:carboxymuconolactone decarboxylase family protein [Streptomyces sp. B-S-A6]MDI3409422.1 carboxymuconolactone decarboxylase family protein [Streptomyces sp. B-S-A6]